MKPKNKRILVAHHLIMMQTVIGYKKLKQKKERRCCAREHLLERERQGDGENLCKELLRDEETFLNFARMSREQFDMLLTKVGPALVKTSMRKAISPKDRFMITLRFLGTGASYSSLGYSFRVAKCTVHHIIKETTEAIWEKLNKEFIGKPSVEQLLKVAQGFYAASGMPNCIRAIEGKHCVIQAPPHSGTLYYNYKKTFSIVLLAVCDSNYNFTFVNVGAYGSESDGGILRRSEWGRKLLNNELPLPEDTPLPHSDVSSPFFSSGTRLSP